MKPSTALTQPEKVRKNLTDIDSSIQSIALTDLLLDATVVGEAYGANGRPTEGDFNVAGEAFSEGLMAPANSRYALRLTPGWSSFFTLFGLEDNHAGSVAFVILGDGKPLYRSSIIRDHILHGITIDVRGVKMLELITEKTDKETTEDWGVWLEPRLNRKPSPEAYPHKFQELRIVAKQVDGCDLKISTAGIEVLGLKKSDPQLSVNGIAWQPKSNRVLVNQGENRFLNEDLDFPRARVHVYEATSSGSVDYAYASDHLRIEMKDRGLANYELVIQIPSKIADSPVDTIPLWGGPWKVAGWEYKASWWGELPTEVPPKETKPFGVGDFPYIDWLWWDDPFPFPATPPDHFVLVGERKFKSDGGVYRVETLTDDALRIKLDGNVIINNWVPQAVTQDSRMLHIPTGVHTLRFEYVDLGHRSRVGVMLRCLEPNGSELQRKTVEPTSQQLATQALQHKAIDKLRALGAYVDEEINSPVPLVTEVNFDGSTQPVGNTVMSALRSLPGIKSLVFGPNDLVPRAWSQLATQNDLQELTLTPGAVDEEDLKEVVKLDNLRSLVIWDNAVNDEKLKHIGGMSNLKVLALWYTPLSDASIDTLAGMTGLRQLMFGVTNITETGVEKLIRARPDIKLFPSMKLRMFWIPQNEETKSIFVHKADGTWHEQALVGEGYHFAEAERSEQFVELFDAARDMRIRLFDDHADMRIGDAEYSRWKSGGWSDRSQVPEGFDSVDTIEKQP